MKVLMAIPARGGSKGLEGKNIRMMNGRPMLAYTVECELTAARVTGNTTVTVSTDSQEIKDVAMQAGAEVPYLRPAHLATDTAGTRDVLVDLLESYERNGDSFDVVILLQPTSPLRIAEDIVNAWEIYKKNECDMVVSVTHAKGNPYFTLFEENADGYLRQSKPSQYTRRQDCPAVYEYNGAVYVIRASELRRKADMKFDRVLKYIMPEERSVDVDTRLDFEIAEFLMKKNTVR